MADPSHKGAAPKPDDALAGELRAGDRRALAKGITLIESTRPDDRARADALLENLLPHSGRSIRIGITGVPGVGKSTFIEAFGKHVIGGGHRLAVLAVDPSSKRGGGAILGDKTRMQDLARRAEAFIRPSPAGSGVGGVARRTREAMLLCEAAGFDVVLVETVGVGQSETAVADMVDMFVLLLMPGGGDELQGLKRGIFELADLVLVNKADGALADEAARTAAEYRQALHLMRPRDDGWRPQVELCSALTGAGIDAAWRTMQAFRDARRGAGSWDRNRRQQAVAWMWSELSDGLFAALRGDAGIRRHLQELEAAVREGKTAPGNAARRLLGTFLAPRGEG